MIVITKKRSHTIGSLISAAFLLVAVGACNKTTSEPETERKPVETTEPTTEPIIEPTTEEQMRAPTPGEPTTPPETTQPEATQPEATQPGATQPPAQQPGSAQDISDEDLNKFAEAYIAVQDLSPQYQEQLLEATPEQASDIQRQAADAMQKEIEKHDMTFEQFTIIAVQLESDPQLQQRFNETLQKMQAEK